MFKAMDGMCRVGAVGYSVETAGMPPDTKGVILSGAPAESNCEAVPSEAMVESWAAAFLSSRLRLLAFGEILRLASIGSLRMTQKMLAALRAFPKKPQACRPTPTVSF